MTYITTIGELLNQPILNSDTYKNSHWTFEHPAFQSSYGYIEARKGGEFEEVQFFGLQYVLRYYMTQRVTRKHADHAKVFLPMHGVPYNEEMWDYIITHCAGRWPVRIKAIPEGMIAPQGCVLVTVESLDENCPGVAAFIETLLLRGVWLPTTIATRSMRWWRLLNEYLKESGTPELAEFKVVDFSARGVRVTEDAGVSGMAHLVNFQVTDNLLGIVFGQNAYTTETMLGYSIPATEHSVTTSWGEKNEQAFYEHILEVHGDRVNPLGGRSPVSVVIDTYDQDNAVRMWLTPADKGGCGLREKLEASNMQVVLRPDSGDPIINVVHMLDLIGSLVGWTINDKGYRVLPDFVRIIQGDGINEDTLRRILQRTVYYKWSIDNVTFGSGGGLMMHEIERDTHRFAMKTSEVIIGGITSEVHKTVKTDPSKASKAGRFAVVYPKYSFTLQTIAERDLEDNTYKGGGIEHNYLQTVFEMGDLVNPVTFDEVREVARNARGH